MEFLMRWWAFLVTVYKTVLEKLRFEKMLSLNWLWLS